MQLIHFKLISWQLKSNIGGMLYRNNTSSEKFFCSMLDELPKLGTVKQERSFAANVARRQLINYLCQDVVMTIYAGKRSVSCQQQQIVEVKDFLDLCFFSLDTAIKPLFNIQQLARTVSLIPVSSEHFFAPWQQKRVILGKMRS